MADCATWENNAVVLSRKNEDRDRHSPYEINKSMGRDIGSLFATATKDEGGATDGTVAPYFGRASISILNKKGVAIVDILPKSINAIERTTLNLIPNAYCRVD
jgi:hypothetical protein